MINKLLATSDKVHYQSTAIDTTASGICPRDWFHYGVMTRAPRHVGRTSSFRFPHPLSLTCSTPNVTAYKGHTKYVKIREQSLQPCVLPPQIDPVVKARSRGRKNHLHHALSYHEAPATCHLTSERAAIMFVAFPCFQVRSC